MTVVEIIDAGLERLEAAQTEAEIVAAFEETRDTLLLKTCLDSAVDAIRAGEDDEAALERFDREIARTDVLLARLFPTP